MIAATTIVTCAVIGMAQAKNSSGIEYDYTPAEIDVKQRDAMLDRLAVDFDALCVGLNGPNGEVLPDLSSVGHEISDLFNVWWFGDEWTLAEYCEERNQQASALTGGDGHQDYFLERVRSVRQAAISVVNAQLKCWMFEGKASPRETGDNPCASVSKLGQPNDQFMTLQNGQETVIDVTIPIRASAINLDDEAFECDAKITISLLWDEADDRWEAFQIIICEYTTGDYWMTSPPF